MEAILKSLDQHAAGNPAIKEQQLITLDLPGQNEKRYMYEYFNLPRKEQVGFNWD
jgi:hypothetical protein